MASPKPHAWRILTKTISSVAEQKPVALVSEQKAIDSVSNEKKASSLLGQKKVSSVATYNRQTNETGFRVHIDRILVTRGPRLS